MNISQVSEEDAILQDVYDALRVAQVHSLHSKQWLAAGGSFGDFSHVDLGSTAANEQRATLAQSLESAHHLANPSCVFTVAIALCDAVAPYFDQRPSGRYDRFRRNVVQVSQGVGFVTRATEIGVPLKDIMNSGDFAALNQLWNSFWLLDATAYLCLKITLIMEMIYRRRLLPWYPDRILLSKIYAGLPAAPLRAWCSSYVATLIGAIETARRTSATLTDWVRAAHGLWIDVLLVMKLNEIVYILDSEKPRDSEWEKIIRRVEETRVDLEQVCVDCAGQLVGLATDLEERLRSSGRDEAEFVLQVLGLGRSLIPYSVYDCLKQLIAERAATLSDRLQPRLPLLMKFKCRQELSVGLSSGFDACRPREADLRSVVESDIAVQLQNRLDTELRNTPGDGSVRLRQAQLFYWQGELAECIDTLQENDPLPTLPAEVQKLRWRATALAQIAAPFGFCSDASMVELINAALLCIGSDDLDEWLRRAMNSPEYVFSRTLHRMIKSALDQGLDELAGTLCSLFSIRYGRLTE